MKPLRSGWRPARSQRSDAGRGCDQLEHDDSAQITGGQNEKAPRSSTIEFSALKSVVWLFGPPQRMPENRTLPPPPLRTNIGAPLSPATEAMFARCWQSNVNTPNGLNCCRV